ncbi:MAG: type II toxin-antitoxin system PemK/MazF family toxin [Vicingaceae bacterium]
MNRKGEVNKFIGNLLNTYAPIVWVCPLTTKLKYYKGDLILNPNAENGLSQKSEVLAMHLRTLTKTRLIENLE